MCLKRKITSAVQIIYVDEYCFGDTLYGTIRQNKEDDGFKTTYCKAAEQRQRMDFY